MSCTLPIPQSFVDQPEVINLAVGSINSRTAVAIAPSLPAIATATGDVEVVNPVTTKVFNPAVTYHTTNDSDNENYDTNDLDSECDEDDRSELDDMEIEESKFPKI